jgi:hypothetical protein
MRRKKHKKRKEFAGEIRRKIKYNRNKNGFQKHKIEDYRSGGESG